MNYWGIFFMTICIILPMAGVYIFRKELGENEDDRNSGNC